MAFLGRLYARGAIPGGFPRGTTRKRVPGDPGALPGARGGVGDAAPDYSHGLYYARARIRGKGLFRGV